MSSVIKSVAVVDRRQEGALPPPPELNVLDHAVIKRNYVPAYSPVHIPSRDAYQDELNELLIEIEDARKEQKELEEGKAELEAEIAVLEVEREKLKKYEGLNIEEEVANKIKAAEQEAERIKTVAHEEAQKSAEALVDALRAQAYLEGLEQGANEARQQVRDENKAGIERLTRLIETLSGARDEIVAENENELVELIITVAEKVIGKQLAEEPKTIIDMLRAAMEANRRENYIKVTLSKDLTPVQAKASEQVKKLIEGMGQQVDVVIDPEMGRGSLLVESPGGFTDLSVSTQLENIRETMKASENEEADT